VYTSIHKCNLPQLLIVVVVFETISSKNKLNSQIISSNHQPLPWSRDQTEEGGRKEEEWWGYWLIHQAHIKKKAVRSHDRNEELEVDSSSEDCANWGWESGA